jgi:hypothetical protein
MPAVDGQEPQPAERPGGNEEERERIRDALVVQMNKGPKYMIFKKNQDEFSKLYTQPFSEKFIRVSLEDKAARTKYWAYFPSIFSQHHPLPEGMMRPPQASVGF